MQQQLYSADTKKGLPHKQIKSFTTEAQRHRGTEDIKFYSTQRRKDAKFAKIIMGVRRSGFSRELSMFAAKAAPTYNLNNFCELYALALKEY